jgi:DNA-3-methyladenine glycosylase I
MNTNSNSVTRCPWSLYTGGETQIYIDYHDNEWGKPVYDDRKLFEMLVLEGMQAGLSWFTILKKRENFRTSFDNFDIEKVAHYDENKIESLLQNEGIIRNKLKINSAVTNAQAILKLSSFSEFMWDYVDGKPIINHPKIMEDVPATTPLSDKISKDLKKSGFKFVGSTIVYSFMQAVGMVNDHLESCSFKYE